MYKIDDYVIYGLKGVCQVVDVGYLDIDCLNKEKKYYTLHPLYSDGSLIYTPVDSGKVRMRKILTYEEAQELINRIPSIEEIDISEERVREATYKATMEKHDCNEWIRIIKTLYLRGQERQQEGKKTTAVDERYLHAAEECLYGELAVSLKMDKDKVKAYIAECVEALQE
ncbi:CarD family transcriptional regulator [Hespellia stercorisuis]|uniref:Transcriptional regulator, CarD family n=1 Tax=Hespellia stercorisuis DSM 15480 TaxID=1121950 RepID=A0A1M6SSL4_9FIRM|nr:CarD family transcriptional regulator [Hespellia stercorisuis]SHK47722.1 transcriptional regulator, CarD family [Hespellia stercorisuis DSM 15480]